MTSLFRRIVLAMFLISLWASPVLAGELSMVLDSGSCSLEQNDQGLTTVSIEGFDVVHQLPGDPVLPSKIVKLLLPPDVRRGSVRLQVEDETIVSLGSGFHIAPAPAVAASFDGQRIMSFEGKRRISDGKDMDIYAKNAFFPRRAVSLLEEGAMRNWQYAAVRFTPLRYNPTTGELVQITSLTLKVTYAEADSAQAQAEKSDQLTTRDNLAPSMFQNFQGMRGRYHHQPSGDTEATNATGSSTASMAVTSATSATGATTASSTATSGYLIVTTKAVAAGSAKLSAFLQYKKNLGHSVAVITEDDYDGLTGQAPNGRAEKIRKWLQTNYSAKGIVYVLLIGDPTPGGTGSTAVPMKMCYPRNTSTIYTQYNPTPTDEFYAELSGNWDLNGDGVFGVFGQDTAAGGIDSSDEVVVGRIPVYGTNFAALDAILQKTIAYESEDASTAEWRKQVLLPMSYSDTSTDGANLGERINTNLLSPAGYSSFRMYQQGSCSSSFNSSFGSDAELTSDAVKGRWQGSAYGLVTWWGHGSQTLAALGGGSTWCGTLFASNEAASLSDLQPAVTFQVSCLNAYPEQSDNLSYSLLKNGAVATVGATRVSWYYVGQTNFSGSPSNAGLSYEFTRRMVQGSSVGKAMVDTRAAVSFSSDSMFMNRLDFNLYGDPEISLANTTTPLLPTDSGLELNASTLSFAGVRAGSMTIQPLIITNPTTRSIDITSMTISGSSAFSIRGMPLPRTLAPGNTAIASIAFRPTTVKTTSKATLTVGTNDSQNPSDTVTLIGASSPW